MVFSPAYNCEISRKLKTRLRVLCQLLRDFRALRGLIKKIWWEKAKNITEYLYLFFKKVMLSKGFNIFSAGY